MSLSDLLGQDRPVAVLRRLLATRKVPPGLLFHGPEGVGKRTAAYAFAKALNCLSGKPDACPDPVPGSPAPCASCAAADRRMDPDLELVDGAYQGALREEDAAKQKTLRIDTVRHVVRKLETRSLEGRWKAAVLDDAHRLTEDGANAMLKALEEPPARTVWVLVTHRPSELLATVRSRCQPLSFAALPQEAVASILERRGLPAVDAARVLGECSGSVSRALALAADPGADPAAWPGDPLAPFTLAESLPRELHLARPRAEALLERAAGWLRRERGTAGFASAPVRFVLRDLKGLRGALRRNADPRLVVELAVLRLQELAAVERSPA
ncbi:AAA family ATPase [bacterium]|nr:MAG: AAA family ATPase [bacterium]